MTSEDTAERGPTHARLSDDTTWPLPDLREDGLAWKLTYGVRLSSAETARVASIVNAYGYLLTATTAERRALIVREVRAALAEPTSRPGACRDCGEPFVPVRRGECSRCGSDGGPITRPGEDTPHGAQR